MLQQTAKERFISERTHGENVTLCAIYQNCLQVMTHSKRLDARLGNYYKWKGQRSKVKRHEEGSNPEKYSIFLVYLHLV